VFRSLTCTVLQFKVLDKDLEVALWFASMKPLYLVVAIVTVGVLLAIVPGSMLKGQGTKPAAKLILWGDIAVFQPPPNPENCIVKNRFKRGEPVGFRLYALDGGTNQPEASAQIVVHITHGGKTYDIPALYRGVPQKSDTGGTMLVRANQWTAKWKVPNDAPIGTVHYSATARDKYGRTAEWTPQGGEPSWVTIVQ
jgi:hypothetical protein